MRRSAGEPMVIIVNDNTMSIGKNVGGLSSHLSRLRSSDNYLDAKRAYRRFMKKTALGSAVYNFSSRVKNKLKRLLLPATIFENMGFTYLGPGRRSRPAGTGVPAVVCPGICGSRWWYMW